MLTLLRYLRSFVFEVPVERVWRAASSVDSYEEWAPWMRDLQVVGDGLSVGTRFIFQVASRLPFRMDLEIEITGLKEGELVEAVISRDLVGHGRLRLRPVGSATDVELWWEVDPASKPLRTLIRFSGPFVRWTQDWAVRAAVDGARRHFAGG